MLRPTDSEQNYILKFLHAKWCIYTSILKLHDHFSYSTLMDWSSDVDQYEEDIFTLLKFHHQDAIRTKELHLKLERAREKVHKILLIKNFVQK